MKEVTLVIIFNHKYNKNIPILDEIYKDKFSDIVYIVPFYKNGELDETKYEIIGVYDSSYSFEGYIAQSYHRLKNHKAESYLFIGDDLLLNPAITEKNFRDYFNVNRGDSYNTEICKINEPFGRYRWTYSRVYHNYMCLANNRFVNFRNEIPSFEEAISIAKEKGYEDFSIDKSFYLKNKGIKGRLEHLSFMFRRIPKESNYPLFGGYSDLVIVDSKDFKEFSHLLGVFSAIGLFVEIAIPTAMVLTCKNIKEQKHTKFDRGDIWGMDNKQAFGEKYNFSLDNLFAKWPKDLLFVHPVKLSLWKK